MNKSNPIVAMHLLLATETFDSTTLKALANMDQSELRNNLAIQRLEAMFNTCKKYDKAVAKFTELQMIYEDSEAGSLPASFKKLTAINMERIPEKYRSAVAPETEE